MEEILLARERIDLATLLHLKEESKYFENFGQLIQEKRIVQPETLKSCYLELIQKLMEDLLSWDRCGMSFQEELIGRHLILHEALPTTHYIAHPYTLF